jgi:hypothetical protein
LEPLVTAFSCTLPASIDTMSLQARQMDTHTHTQTHTHIEEKRVREGGRVRERKEEMKRVPQHGLKHAYPA